MSPHHLSASLIVSVLTLASGSAVVPPAREDRALTSSGSNPTRLPTISAAILRALVIFILLMTDRSFLLCTTTSGAWPPTTGC